MNLLATAAAFGVAKLVFQDGHGEGLLGFTSQGFVDAWAPIFFFALIFALAMDYTVFLLSSIRAELERAGDPRAGLVEGLAGSGRVINAAGAVMVVVFFTFALSGPLAPKEMGVILGAAVLLDTLLIRLLLLPAALRLLGPAAWWTPRLLDRLPQGFRLRHGGSGSNDGTRSLRQRRCSSCSIATGARSTCCSPISRGGTATTSRSRVRPRRMRLLPRCERWQLQTSRWRCSSSMPPPPTSWRVRTNCIRGPSVCCWSIATTRRRARRCRP